MHNKKNTIVVVGSKNPVKIEATKIAFQKVWSDRLIQVHGVNAASGVSDQPMSDLESIKGAMNRATLALETDSNADYGVGLEGGLQQIGDKWFDCGWIVVLDRNSVAGVGSSIRMETPPKMLEMIKNGMELGDVIDHVFDVENSKQNEGHFGLMTNNALSRTHGYIDAVISALSRFIVPEVW